MQLYVLGVRAGGIQKCYRYVLLLKSFIKFMFSTVYRVTQKWTDVYKNLFELLCTMLKT
jgi:hypothetical protein